MQHKVSCQKRFKKDQKGLNVEWNFEFNYTRPKCWNAKICQHMKILKKPDFTGRLVSAWSSPCWLLLAHLLASKKTLMSCVCSASAVPKGQSTQHRKERSWPTNLSPVQRNENDGQNVKKWRKNGHDPRVVDRDTLSGPEILLLAARHVELGLLYGYNHLLGCKPERCSMMELRTPQDLDGEISGM